MSKYNVVIMFEGSFSADVEAETRDEAYIKAEKEFFRLPALPQLEIEIVDLEVRKLDSEEEDDDGIPF